MRSHIYRMAHTLGIDVGLQGALAVVDDKWNVVAVHDMPTNAIVTNGKTRKRVDARALCVLLAMLKKQYAPAAVWVEDVHATPWDGAVGAFSFGRSAGITEAAIAAAGMLASYVKPAMWKAKLNVPKDKDASRARATALVTSGWAHWPLKKHDGRAEASMIAIYGMEYGNAAV